MAGTAFGPLVEPGWPNLQGPDLARNFLSGAQLGASINAKQRALENQLAGLTLKAQAMEYDHELDRAKFGLAQDKLQMQADRNAALLDIAHANLGLREQTANLAVTKYNDLVEGKSGLVEAQAILDSEHLHPGDEGYIERFNQLTAPIIGKVPTSTLNAVQRSVYNNNNAAIKEKQQYLNSDTKHFTSEASGILYGNANPVNPDLTPVIDYEKLPNKWSGGGWFGGDVKIDPTVKLVPQTDGTEREVAVSELRRLNARYKELDGIRQSLAKRHVVDRPDLGVHGGDTIRIRDSSGKQWTIPSTSLETAKERDPGLTIVP